jgi:Ca2+-transporting ATPase
MDVQEVATRLDVKPARGLSSRDVADRRRRFGLNRVVEPPEPSLARLFAQQLVNAPTALLAAGAAISVVTGGVLEAALILTVVGANAIAGAATERTGHRAISALRHSAAIRARVKRDGRQQVLEADEVVPGDVIDLIIGDPVPADARLVEAHHLKIEESALTGESQPAEKIEASVAPAAPVADRRSMVFRGTTVVSGRGRAIVVATGEQTAFGELHVLAAAAEAPPTPLERDLDRIGRGLAIGAGSICAGVLGLGLLRGGALLQSLEVAVSLGVAAIPEGLTALATSVLALASGRMRRRGTLIRTLNAAEALGSVTVVCADKTGTLTENRMAARDLFVDAARVHVGGPALRVSGTLQSVDSSVLSDEVVRRALRVGVLCSDAELAISPNGGVEIDGSATEGALQVAAAKAGLDVGGLRERYPRLDVRDRADGRRHMVTVHRIDGRLVALLKGSPEEVLGMSTQVARADGDRPLDDAAAGPIAHANGAMADRAMRVLALAERPLADTYRASDLEHGFTFLGLVGLVDPIRPDVPAAIEALRGAGIRTVMITGDQVPTAVAVARELGLQRSNGLRVLEAGDLAALSPEALRAVVRDVAVFARVEPAMKLAVVRALQANGEVVGMTGDGVSWPTWFFRPTTSA